MNLPNYIFKTLSFYTLLLCILLITNPISEHLSKYLFSDLLNGDSILLLTFGSVLKFVLSFGLFAAPSYLVYEKFYGVKKDDE